MQGLSGNYYSIGELYKAYRKAKSDAFHDKSNFSLVAFANYEQKLESNLKRLLRKLRGESGAWSTDLGFIGDHSFLPKSVDAPESRDPRVIHFATLDPLRDWETQCRLSGKRVVASFRQVILPTVDYQIVSALWLIKVGEKYDGAIDKRLSYAHSLRRVGSQGPIAMDAGALFVPYIGGYRSWRERGLRAMRSALEAKKSIVAITMDVKRFYHNVSPNFLLRPDFLKRLLVSLTAEDKVFTERFIASINTWYEGTPDAEERPQGALPVGLSASRVISNVLLAEFDRIAHRELGAIYYGRYADDIFLVVEKPDSVDSGEHFVKWLRKRLSGWLVLQSEEDGSGLRLHLSYARDSKIVFSSQKQKIFFLSGEHGFDLLNQISDKIQEQSSQFRMLPELPSSESRMAAQALLATPDARLEADALRKAEAVSIRRFGFSMLLSDVEAYARDLEPGAWLAMRRRFYGLVSRYVMTPSGFFDYFAYIVRVFGLMVACRDYSAARDLLGRFEEVVSVLSRTTTVGSVSAEEFRLSRRQYLRGFLQVALQAATVEKFSHVVAYRKLIAKISRSKVVPSSLSSRSTSTALLKADLGRRPYHEYWFNERRTEKRQPPLPEDYSVRKIVALTRRFRGKVAWLKAPYWPAVAFPTRPIPLWSLCISAPNLLFEEGGLEEVLMMTRGALVNPRYVGHRFVTASRDGSHVISVPGSVSPERKFGLPSYLADFGFWKDAVAGNPDLSLERYEGLRRLVNRMLRDTPDVQYVAFPECSIPLRWALQIAQKLGQRGVSLIAGIENRGAVGNYTNEALVSLASNYFGKMGSICFLQPKMELAVHEAEECNGAKFRRPGEAIGRPTYVHGGFCFGVIICSDLTTIANRAHFQGAVDALFVLEWNKDLSTFEFLVESAAHDLHAAIVQVNNREYGDSRIRVPFEDAHKRDVVQVRGGDEDFYVVSTIDFSKLREFQRSPVKNGGFKPLPIGYAMSPYRRDARKNGGW